MRVCLCAGWGGGWEGLLWVMAPVWQGSDRYVIMLTMILPPIVLPETNLLKIHPIPSSPSSANSLQREWEWWKEKRHRESGDEYQKHGDFFGAALQNSCSYCGLKCSFAVIGEPFLCLLLYSFWHAVVAYLLRSICSSMESVWEWSDLLAATLITH